MARGSRAWRRAGRWALLGIGLATAGLLAWACSSGPNVVSSVSYIVVPHPDDEMQAWSLIEDTPGTYKVFIMLTRGEQTAYCDSPGLDEGTGEAAPTPRPHGRWTASCEQARVNAFFEFMAAMAPGDSGLPSSFDHRGITGPFDSMGSAICRHDGTDRDRDRNRNHDGADHDDDCLVDLTAEVWTSPLAAVVWFNLGDGDLTAEETAWAIATVRDNRAALGIDSMLEVARPDAAEAPEGQQGGARPTKQRLIGASYWNSMHPGCFVYEHDDHLAVREALWNIDFGLGEQIVATCASDPDASLSASVTPDRFDAAFETAGSQRIGAHLVHYGWLWSDSPGYWAGDYSGQDELFHRRQSFRVRYGPH